MITKVAVPKISANVEEETITAWFKKEGETVRKGEPLLEITTDKACVEIESPRAGCVRSILAKEKSVLPVGYIVALIGNTTDPLPDVSRKNIALMTKHRSRISRKGKTMRKHAGKARTAVRATPAARRLARELGLDLQKLATELKVEVIDTAMVQKAYKAK